MGRSMENVAWIAISVLMFLPTMATGGTSYDLIFRDPMQPTAVPLVSRHFVQDGKVRVELPQNAVLIFNAQAMYVIDYAAKTMRVQPPRDQSVAKIGDQIDRIRAKAQAAPPEQRATMEKAAQVLQQVQSADYQTVQREYTATARSELVDGHWCRVWTETEEEAKRLELCVVDTTSVPGGDLILDGMKTLSRYAVFGSIQAFGVQFGHGEWWTGIESLKGLPVLIRELKSGNVISEVTIANVHQNVPAGSLFDIPRDYPARLPRSP